MQFVNLTGHTITLLNGNDPVEFLPSGTIVRLREKIVSHEIVEDVKIKSVEYETDGRESWPQPRDGILYIVSYMIAQSVAKERDDLVFPFDLVRKPGGVIIGCRSFARIAKN